MLLPATNERYDPPTWTTAKPHWDHHIQVADSALLDPGTPIGETVSVRVDRRLVKSYTALPTSQTVVQV